MTATKSAPKTIRRRTRFSFYAGDAKSVNIAGDFNGWRETGKSLKVNGDGVWQITLMLPPGTYEYKFLVDGRWENDPSNDRMCINCFGTRNNLVHIR